MAFAVLEYRVTVVGDEEKILAQKKILDEEITPLVQERVQWLSVGAKVYREGDG